MPSKQCGIPRDWSKSEQLSVSERISLKSGSVSASARYINSVSDLYAADEIDALLDEIRDLEPISVHTDDLQDFEIDGSVSRLPYNNMACDSRTSVHSWDSHALYTNNHRMHNVESVGGPIYMYCNSRHLKTPAGILRITLLVTSIICLALLCSSGTDNYGLFSLPYADLIRLMLFVILFTLLVTLLLLFLDISLLYHAFPFHYHRMVVCIYVTEFTALIGSSALIAYIASVYQDSYPWITKGSRNHLIAATAFGFLSGLVALLLAVYGIYELCHYRFPNKREDTDQLTLTERAQQQQEQGRQNYPANHHQPTYPQRSTRYQPRIQSLPMTAEPPISATVWPIEDEQPCSSRHVADGTTDSNHILVDVSTPLTCASGVCNEACGHHDASN